MRAQPTSATRAFIGLLCALLLFAQQVGLAHAAWHAGGGAAAHATHDGERHQHQPDTDAQRELCAYHSALGTALAACCGEAPAFIVPPADCMPARHADSQRATPEVVPAVSRGPPVFL